MSKRSECDEARFLRDVERRELWETVEREVMSEPGNEHVCVAAIWNFYHTTSDGERFEFMDFFDGSMNRFTFRFLWCCYALAWGINQYDNYRSSKS